MADKKISQLTSAVLPLAGTELVPVVQSGATVKVTAASLGAAAAYTPAGTGAVVTTVQSKLRESVSVKDFGAVGDGVTNDTAAIQAAINAAGSLASIVYPDGSYRVASSITLLPQQHHIGMNARIVVDSGITAFTRTTDGFPGRIKFSDIRFEGTGFTGKAISITNNTPFVEIENCYFSGFLEGVRLDGSYCSNVKNSYFSYNRFGLLLLNESHSSSLINCFFDGNTYTGLGVNGESSGGNIGSIPIHSVTTVGCVFQNGEFGVWAEECYELHLINTYHEGNSKADLRLGVADAGVYGRFCYHFTVDGWQSSSPCASGKNIIIQHAVGGNLRGLAFNSGCSTTATLLEVDGFSDKISVDYHRFTTITPTATAPFDVQGAASAKVVIANNGRLLLRSGLQALNFGWLDGVTGRIYGGLTPVSSRPTLQFDSLGSNQDMSFKVQDVERHYDSANNLRFSIDHLNSRVETAYTLRTTTDNTLNLGGAANRWATVYAGTGTINTSDAREKQQVRTLSDAEKAVATKVKGLLRAFKFNDAIAEKGDSARIHFGVIAQEVKAAFESEGLIAESYAALCYDEWEDQYDADMNLMQPSGNRYGVRYEELLAFIIAAL